MTNFSKILKQLNVAVSEAKEKFEGSIFYLDGDKVRKELYLPFEQKRIDFAEYAKVNNIMVEVGVNAGHSALLALSSNPNLTYIGIDILWHQYTLPCIKILQKHFPGRVHFLAGSSIEVLPNVYESYPNIKGEKITWVVDGGHEVWIADTDVKNVLTLASNNDLLIFDDIEQKPLHDLIEEYTKQEKLKTIKKTEFQWFLTVDKP